MFQKRALCVLPAIKITPNCAAQSNLKPKEGSMGTSEPRASGLFEGISNESYHADKTRISKSGLDLIHRSPAHYKYSLTQPFKSTPALEFGSIFHAKVLTPKLFDDEYYVLPDEKIDKRTAAGKAKSELWERLRDGRKVVLPTDFKIITGMHESVKNHKRASELLESAHTEITCFWTDEETGIDCKCRPDALTDVRAIIDLKSTRDASPKEFEKAIANYRYHVQAAFYLDGVSRFGDFDKFIFIAVEKEPPYAVGVYEIDIGAIEFGREKYRKDLETFNAHKKSDKWTAYSEEVEMIGIPHWEYYN